MKADNDAAAEHRIQMPESGRQADMAAAAAPEKWLNRFVRSVALIERVGNALGTLAFTWATVILLGGYPTKLHSKDDFAFATIIVFLEAARMFTGPNNKSDYQLFFRTRGAFRSLGGNGLIVIVYFWGATLSIRASNLHYVPRIVLIITVMVLLVVGQILFRLGRKPRTCNWWPRRAISLWSPVVAILLLAFAVLRYYDGAIIMWMAYGVLVVAVILATVGRLRFPIIINLVHSALGSRHVFWRRIFLNSCMLAAIVMPLFVDDPDLRKAMVAVDICAVPILSLGNFQIPAALVRVMLAGLRLGEESYNGEGDTANLFTSLQIFYGMVFAQGLLYVFAGMVEFLFSFITRRSLVRHGGLTGQWGVESVDLYYEYAFSKYMKGGLFAPERISLSNFAIDSLNSDLSKNQLYGVWMMHIFLQRHPTREQLLEKLNTSAQTMARLISMLDWTRRNEHPTIRLYAAKVVAELAKSLRVVIVPGAMQLVSTLLDTDGKPEKGHPLLDADDYQDPFVDTTVKQEKRQDATGHHQGKTQETLGDTDRLLETPNRSTRTNAQTSILRCWRKISAYWSIPKEQPLTDNDLLPALGMSIVYNLVGCDQNNLLEIDRVTDLIPKITGFTSFRSAIMNSESQQKVLLKSSLKVLQRLTRIEGEIGITLRYKISKHPFLFRNLAEILGDSSSNQELRKLVAGILRNLAIDRDTRQEIGQMQMLITMLMKAFLDSSRSFSSNVDCLLPKVAGQALVMLSSENPHNCFVMLKEPDFINKLKNMILIHDDKYIYVAVSLLRNMCLHAQPELTESDLKELSHTLGEVSPANTYYKCNIEVYIIRMILSFVQVQYRGV
uniref:BLE2 protein n=1 Tax=Oryza sativa subsp. japonica TaxID=39947 RepID=Q6YSC7_ORYSJ|nr:putative BLE2 protein [Oryza sativa Japonica Group]